MVKEPFFITKTSPEERAWARRFNAPLGGASRWVKWIGWTRIIGGALVSATLFGLPWGLALIASGLLALKVAAATREAQAFGHKSDALAAQEHLAILFRIQGLTTMVFVGMTVIGVLTQWERVLWLIARLYKDFS